MLLIFAGRDGVSLLTPKKRRDCERFWLEAQLPPLLSEISPKEIYFVSWPWSFTNLRVTCLTVNSYKLFHPETTLYEHSKISLYKETTILPDLWLLFIWQKKRARLYDFKNNFHTKVLLTEHQESQWDVFSEDMETQQSSHPSVSRDIKKENKDNGNNGNDKKNTLTMMYEWKEDSREISEWNRASVENVSPHYMIQATVSKPKDMLTSS